MSHLKNSPQNRARIVAVVGDKFLTITKRRIGIPPRITFPGLRIVNMQQARLEAVEHFCRQTGISIDVADLHPEVIVLRVGRTRYYIFVLALSETRYTTHMRRSNVILRTLHDLTSLARNGSNLGSTLEVIKALEKRIARSPSIKLEGCQKSELIKRDKDVVSMLGEDGCSTNAPKDRNLIIENTTLQGVCSGGHTGAVDTVCTHEFCSGAPFRP